MKISLVTATLGRVVEIERLLKSLSEQTYKKFELFIVDQNPHHEVQRLVDNYSRLFKIIYIRSDKKGLSRNRNLALPLCDGDVVGFPDDDCYYDPKLLEYVVRALKDNASAKFCTVATYNSLDGRLVRGQQNPLVTRKQIFELCISINFFCRKNDVRFDERLGVGCYFSSGEETDYLFSFLSDTDYGVFCQEAKVYHPFPVRQRVDFDKIYRYSLGFGALCKKDYLGRGNSSSMQLYLKYILRAFVGMCLFRKCSYYNFIGKIRGYIEFKV